MTHPPLCKTDRYRNLEKKGLQCRIIELAACLGRCKTFITAVRDGRPLYGVARIIIKDIEETLDED